MKKVTGILLVVMMMGFLGGCYSSACNPPCALKGEG